jgi:hypothetical protein
MTTSTILSGQIFEHPIQELTYNKVADYLRSATLFQDSLLILPDRPRFQVSYGSAIVDIEVSNWAFHPWNAEREMAIVTASSCVTQGSLLTTELTQYLLRENRRMRFGGFQLDENFNIWFSHSILGGEHMDLTELQSCILAVVTIADNYDDALVQEFGGKRSIDIHLSE